MHEIEVIVARMLLRLVEDAASALRPVAEGSLKPGDARAAERLAAALRDVASAAQKLSTPSAAPAGTKPGAAAKVSGAKRSEGRRRGRKPMLIEHQGQRKTAMEWAALFDTSKAVIHSRRQRGVPIDGSVSRRGQRQTPAAAGAPAAPMQPSGRAAATAGTSAAAPGRSTKPELLNGHSRPRVGPCSAPPARATDRMLPPPVDKTPLDPLPVPPSILALSPNSVIEARGKRQTIAAWSRECDVPVAAVLGRLRQGRPIELALEPVRR
jgi:hypothetical protein